MLATAIRPSRSMQPTYVQLAERLAARSANLSHGEQFWLGIAGPPGSGKSTLCQALLDDLGTGAIAIPMDGYHYYRAELDRMANPTEAHRRRGAPFTFDANRFVTDLAKAKRCREGHFPSFEHGLGDPVGKDIVLQREVHRIVIVEGNYLLLDDPPWRELKPIFDETWYLDVSVDRCKERVRQRLLATGRDEETARFRVDYNDGPNAELVARVSPKNADIIVTAG